MDEATQVAGGGEGGGQGAIIFPTTCQHEARNQYYCENLMLSVKGTEISVWLLANISQNKSNTQDLSIDKP